MTGANSTVAKYWAELKIAEAVPSGEQVAGITTSSNASIVAGSQSGGSLKVAVGTGPNIVTFDNEPVGPPQTGFLEICKVAGDQYIDTVNPFIFQVTDHTGAKQTVPVLAGQCAGGKLRIYPNRGTAKEPKFDNFTWFLDGKPEGTVPAS